MLKTKLSLHHILGFIVVFTTIIIMGLYTVHSYTTVKSETIKQLEHDALLSLKTLESNIASLINAYAVSEYQQLLQTETVRFDSNIAIIVEDYKMAEISNQKHFYVGIIRDADWNVIDYNFKAVEQNKQLKESYYSHEYRITGTEGEDLGIIRIYISNNDLTLKLNNIIKDNVIRIFIVMFMQIIVFFFTIEYFIKKPLSNIIKIISNTDADGVPIKQTFEYNSKEISILASSMNAMLDEIRNSRAKLKLKNKELQLSSSVFKDTHGGIMITDANQLIVDVNPAFCKITGYSRAEVIGKSPKILSSGKQSHEFYQCMWQKINEQGHWQGDLWNHKKNGELYAALLTISGLKNDDSKIATYVGVFTDITDSKKQKEQLSLMAHYDVLTGLPNRALFTDRFTQAIAYAHRTETQLAVCFLDLDDFKPVNDNYGHQVGDQLLIEVAKRITANLRDEDTVSRQGGDEFALLLNNIESFSQCEQTLERIHYALAKPYIINEHPIQITASTGISLSSQKYNDIDTLIRHADQAMYQAKLTGKNHFHLFNPEQDQRTIQKHHQLEEIKQALSNKEFQLYYQPKVNMNTGDVFGVEALIRWIHPEKGLIPPLDFLPILEGTDLEVKIGNWVINEAVTQLNAWHQQDMKPEVSVNISSHHLLSASFITELGAALTKYPAVDSKYFQLEILESSALGDLNVINNIIKTCKATLGVKVALDDFGTGYSSLTHLRNLPVDIIKIDQSFVRDMLDDPNDFTIIDGIIGLANSFNLDAIAEGVETTEHGLMLLMMGCEQAQGYGIAKPMLAKDYTQWIQGYIPNKEWQQCGNKRRSTKETQVNLFRLVTKQWESKFTNNIQSSPDEAKYWPIMNSKYCSSGMWITRAKQEQLFELNSLKQLEIAHEALHHTAQALHFQYKNGDIDTVKEGLPELQAAFKNMNNALEMCNTK